MVEVDFWAPGPWLLEASELIDDSASHLVPTEPSPENIACWADAGVEEDGLELDQDELVLPSDQRTFIHAGMFL